VGSQSQSWGGKKASELGVRSELFGELGEVFGEGRWRVGRLGGVQRSPEVPCMVCFRHRTGAKTGAGHLLGTSENNHPWLPIRLPNPEFVWDRRNKTRRIMKSSPAGWVPNVNGKGLLSQLGVKEGVGEDLWSGGIGIRLL